MDTRNTKSLELISRRPKKTGHATPLLFVHGAFAGAWCWDEHFLSFFADHVRSFPRRSLVLTIFPSARNRSATSIALR